MAKKFTEILLRRLLIAFSVLGVLSCSEEKRPEIKISSDADLSGLKVATVSGSVYDLDLSSRTDISLQLYNSTSDVLQALLNGTADVVVHDEMVFNAGIRKENGIKIACAGSRYFPTAFMFSKDDCELASTCTAVQRRMQEDGTMQRLKDFWLSDRYVEATSYSHIPDEGEGEPLRVATSASTAPLSFSVDGEWYGIEIDIIRELAKQLNRPLQIKRYDPSGGIMAIKSGKADILCGCLFITPEREKEFQFSEPYHYYQPAYFVLDPDATPQKHSFISWLKKSFHRNLVIENRWKYIVRGLLKTLKITLLAILMGSVLGMGLYAMIRSRRKWVRNISSCYNSVMTGMPELVLLLILFYVVFANSNVPSDLIAAISFSLFFGSSASGIYKTALDAVPHGQTEAGLALGFTRVQTFFNIVLPQALRYGLPLYKSRCISLLKGTSIVGYIAIQDLTRAGDMIRSRTFDALIPLLVVTVIYFLLAGLIVKLLDAATPKKKAL